MYVGVVPERDTDLPFCKKNPPPLRYARKILPPPPRYARKIALKNVQNCTIYFLTYKFLMQPDDKPDIV